MLTADGILQATDIPVASLVRDAGVVGAGGAGFPTHVKLGAKAGLVIANGAECEPLLCTDQTLMRFMADRVVLGLEAAMRAVGATRGVIATKKHYHDAVQAISHALTGRDALSLFLMDSYYPAGDEKSLIHDVTGEVVRSAKLPADYGCVVCNIGTLTGIADALEGHPVTEKLLTVCGDVPEPAVLRAPVGTAMRELIAATGFAGDERSHTVIEGGPLMGTIRDAWDAPITKMTGGLLVLPREHPLIAHKSMPVARQIKIAMAVCCQCNMCTILCPRNSLGLHVEPHKAMRAIANGSSALMGDVNGILACCSCNLCSHYACNFGLTPGTVMHNLRQELLRSGVRPQTEADIRLDGALATKRIPVSRLIARMGLSKYDRPAVFRAEPLTPRRVTLLLSQHAGQPAQCVVKAGQKVSRGELVARIPEGALGANIHASIPGTVTRADADAVCISC